MTHKQFETKARGMLRNVHKELLQEMIRLARSGGMDLARYRNDYTAARVTLWAAMEKVRHNFAPLHPDAMGDARNLTHF